MEFRLARAGSRLGLGALVGLVSAGIAIGIGELVAAFVRPAAAPIIAVGNKFILLTPESLKDYAIRQFGSNDKNMLLLGIYVVIGLLAVALGVLALRWLWVGVVGLVLFGAVGVYAAATANAARGGDVVPTILGTLCAIAVLIGLVRTLGTGDRRPFDRRVALPATAASGTARRGFLIGGVSAAGLAAATGFGGRALQHRRFDAAQSRAAVLLPKPTSPAPPLPAHADLAKGAATFITPNRNFYRVDTALTVPQLNAKTWQLRVGGRVDHELTLSFDDLLARPLIERYITMTCVSDPVGGPYIGTAKFLGAPLADLLREAGVHPDADQIVGRSSDGMTIGTPTTVIMDGRDAMLAVGMNDEPLPLEHGFPVRMLVPGLYGYVSATKWLVELQATRFADFDGYWVQRGWVQQAPIQLESRIDTPRPFARLRRGTRVMIAGVAWHQHVGVGGVQVQVGDGPWQTARLGQVPSTDTWVQWVLPWTVEGDGPVTLRVRAIDRDGKVQSSKRAEPYPAAASGWHSVVVQVS
ncbi:MAG TPA: molybdopterin-dependent oxidoreductase [Jatrophihabitantaceae bacterium]|nr:molybdopterin-dependent oxidoreductase [Jatrophihabitantaceae bacterium]